MLALNNVNVLENDRKQQSNNRDIGEWPIMDSRGNTIDDLPPRSRNFNTQKKVIAENNNLSWRVKTPETDDEKSVPKAKRDNDYDDLSDDDIDDDDEMELAIANKLGNSERNYMYPEHQPQKSNPAKPAMLKFKAGLFSRNVLVVNRAMKQLMNRNKSPDEVPEEEDTERKGTMVRQGQARVRSSKRRQALSIRNQFNELSVNYEDLLKENKILKQIQKRQERELDKYTNADEDLPRLLDANSYEIAGLKSKNKQMSYEKREMDDKLRRQHQEIMSLKEANKKLHNLSNNKKLGEREKLEMDLTTARVTIAHQENKIQDLTKAVEIYKKTADREVKGNTLQLKKTQKNLRELQDAYNELFIKYKAKEKEADNHNIYAQRARQIQPQRSKRSFIPGQLNKAAAPSTAEITPRRTKYLSAESSFQQSSLEAMDTELEAQNKALENLKCKLSKETKPLEREKSVSPSTLASSDSEDDLAEPSPKRKDPAPIVDTGPSEEIISDEEDIKPSININVKSDNKIREKREAEERRKREEEEAHRKAEEARRKVEEEQKAAEARRKAEEEKQKTEERRRQEEEKRLREEKEAAEVKERAEEEKEAMLTEERLKKDAALKEKLAALKKNTGGDDFMSQLKASKKNTPNSSPASSIGGNKSPGMQTVTPNERLIRNSGPDDGLRKTAAINNTRRKKSIDDETSSYQPSFVKSKPKHIEKKDPMGIDIGEYTPSFSSSNRISREKSEKQWTPAGRASVSEKNGLFDLKAIQKPSLRRRPSQQSNKRAGQSDLEDDLEELML